MKIIKSLIITLIVSLLFGINCYATAGTGIIPVMTSNSLPSPYAASSSNATTGYEAFRAFDNDYNTSAGIFSSAGWLKIDLGAVNAVAVNAYNITPSYSPNYAIKNFTFSGSNNNSTWVILDTHVDVTASSFINYSGQTFYFTNTTAYRYYKIDVSAWHSTYYTISMDLFTLTPTSTPAISVDDSNNTINNIDNSMEYSLNSVGTLWTTYVYGSPPNLEGNTIVYIRKKGFSGFTCSAYLILAFNLEPTQTVSGTVTASVDLSSVSTPITSTNTKLDTLITAINSSNSKSDLVYNIVLMLFSFNVFIFFFKLFFQRGL